MSKLIQSSLDFKQQTSLSLLCLFWRCQSLMPLNSLQRGQQPVLWQQDGRVLLEQSRLIEIYLCIQHNNDLQAGCIEVLSYALEQQQQCQIKASEVIKPDFQNIKHIMADFQLDRVSVYQNLCHFICPTLLPLATKIVSITSILQNVRLDNFNNTLIIYPPLAIIQLFQTLSIFLLEVLQDILNGD